MKNRIFLFVLAVFSLFISVNLGTQKTLAQAVPCTQCDEIGTTYTYYTDIPPSGDCAMEITYVMKFCPEPAPTGRWNIEVGTITMMPWSSCSFSNEDIMKMAVKALLFYHYTNSISYGNTIRVTTPNCLEEVLIDEVTKYQSCGTDCCVNDFILKNETIQTGVDIIQLDSQSNVATSLQPCPTIPNPSCSPICESLNIETDVVLGSSYVSFPAECDQCNSVWSSDPSQVIIKSLPNGCKLIASYSVRYCDSNQYKELLLRDIYVDGNCSAYNTNDLVKAALEGILAVAGVKPEIKVITATCWEEKGTWNSLTFYRPCIPLMCCEIVYYLTDGSRPGKFRRDGSPTLQVSGPLNCIDYECSFICDLATVDIPIGVDLQKLSKDTQREETPSSTLIIPNPAKGNTDLHFTSSFVGEVEIRISDNLGNIIFKDKLMKDKSELIYQFNTSGLAKGAYHYNVSSGIFPLSGGSFIVE